MKKTLTIAICLFLSVMVISCAMRKSEPIKQQVFTPTNGYMANGEQVFMTHCHKCHPSGESGLGPAINSNPAPQFVKRFQMRHGLGVMPGFTVGEISRSDLHDISKYLRAWKHYK